MSTLSELIDQIATCLQDPNRVAWTDGEIELALRLALAEYSQSVPLCVETVLSLPGSGADVALDALDGLQDVTGAAWPYSTLDEPPANALRGWQLRWDDARPVLHLVTLDGSTPQAGDELFLGYAKAQTVQGLEGAALTSLSPAAQAQVVQGAAGLAALSGSLDRSEVLDRLALREWGVLQLKRFREAIQSAAAARVRAEGSAWGVGWEWPYEGL